MKVNGEERKMLRETREIVIRLDEHIKSLDENLSHLPCSKEEERISKLEQQWWKVVGGVSVAVFIINFMLDKFMK